MTHEELLFKNSYLLCVGTNGEIGHFFLWLQSVGCLTDWTASLCRRRQDFRKTLWTFLHLFQLTCTNILGHMIHQGTIISQSKVDDKLIHRSQKKSEDRRVETAVFSSVPGESADWRQGFSGSWSWMKSWRPWTACCLQVRASLNAIPCCKHK